MQWCILQQKEKVIPNELQQISPELNTSVNEELVGKSSAANKIREEVTSDFTEPSSSVVHTVIKEELIVEESGNKQHVEEVFCTSFYTSCMQYFVVFQLLL